MKGENGMISIVAPVYNVESYIKQFIESILEQTYTDFELILVDDCATDSSGEICQQYAAKDRRIRYFRQEKNGGVAKARNRGLKEAKGEYIMLADSDDYLPKDALGHLYSISIEQKADIVYGGFWHVKEPEGMVVKKSFRVSHKVYDHKQAVKAHLNFKTLYGYPWGKLFKKAVLAGVEDPEDMNSGDDGVFSFRALWNANKVVFDDKPVYYYRIRNDSLTNRDMNITKKDFQVEKQYQYVKECVADDKFYKELGVFQFGLYLDVVVKYERSKEVVKKEFSEQIKPLKMVLKQQWWNVVRYSINPRMKLKAIQYAMKKHL